MKPKPHFKNSKSTMTPGSVPFKIQNVFQGFAEAEGFLSIDKAELKLEFQTSDNILGLLKSGVREVRVPLDKIEEISFRKSWKPWKRWGGCSMIIQVSEMRGASEVPNFKHGEIALTIATRDSQAASDFVSAIQIASGCQGSQ
jgi:hypothetical protein